MSQTDLYFIALLPPPEIQAETTAIKQHFSDRYHSRAALKSPPHITLQPPFKWEADHLANLHQQLHEFALQQTAVPIALEGFAAFPPRVIYINVLKTPELLALKAALMAHLATTLNLSDPVEQRRPFSPHLTVAFRDLTRQHFKTAWADFQHRPFSAQFTVSHLTLLRHDGKRWQIHREFPLDR
ncbi:2'-5' RNA ligase family protein [Pantanalinema rosaneae CENA516]|uniref:2'-5' RNA ligase family protein n=1 Tax=Pantanalinema rosaneae TaxID=1620701 RepID=UPI003D6DF649